MNPILASALFGLTKGMLREGPPSLPFGKVVVTGPVMEEVLYRAVPKLAGVPSTVSALGFAVDHVKSEGRSNDLARFADVFAGGLLYESAYKQFGLLGAIAAHASHNLALYLVKGARSTRTSPLGGFGPTRKRRKKRR